MSSARTATKVLQSVFALPPGRCGAGLAQSAIHLGTREHATCMYPGVGLFVEVRERQLKVLKPV